MSRKRLVGGIAVNLTPPRKGASWLSRLSAAQPPIGCTLRARRWPQLYNSQTYTLCRLPVSISLTHLAMVLQWC